MLCINLSDERPHHRAIEDNTAGLWRSAPPQRSVPLSLRPPPQPLRPSESRHHMRASPRSLTTAVVLTAAVVALAYASPLRHLMAHDEPPPGSGGSYTPDTCVEGHNVCGDFEPLTPMHGAEGVHAGLIWKAGAAMPKILYWARFTDYTGIDVADPAVIQAKIDAGALTDKKNVNDFNASLRGGDVPGGAADSFKRLVYGGFNIVQGLSQSVPTRILGELQH